MRINIEVTGSTENIIRVQSVNAKKNYSRISNGKGIKKTANWLKSKAAKEISEEKKIALKLIRKRLKIVKASRNTLTALVRANLYDVRASSVGRMKQARKGAEVGKYQFTGAFIAKMPRNYKGIFKPKGKRALPIQEIRLPIESEGLRIMKELADYEAEKISEKFFHRELS